MENETQAPTRNEASLDSLVASVVDDFRERQKQGDQPDIEEYAARHPEAASLLRKVLATMRVLDGSPAPQSAGEFGISEAHEAPLSGTLGDFRILREVGRGGMGIVYEAEQISLGRRVALKVLPFASTLDSRQLQRFHNEARAAASLHHEHIVPVFAVGQERGVHFFAMQFIEGQTLSNLIREQKIGMERALSDAPTTGPGGQASAPALAAETIPIARATTASVPRDSAYFKRITEWMIQAALALEHAHCVGIVHRDVKPGNLMIDGAGRLWVADFGLARRANDSDLTMTGDLLGTIRYMSPEQASAKHDLVDHRSDIYSLGATLYELLTLKTAVEGKERQEILHNVALTDPKNLRSWDRRIPIDLETIVLKALAKEPEARYASAKELADDLQRYLNHETIRARRPSILHRFSKWTRRNRPVITAAFITLLAVCAAITSVFAVNDYLTNPERIREEIQAELTAGRAVTLVGEFGPPRLLEWGHGFGDSKASNLKDRPFFVSTYDTALIQLWKSAPPAYRLRAEIRHDATHSGEVGLYFGHATPDQNFQIPCWFAATFSDKGQRATSITKDGKKGNYVRMGFYFLEEGKDAHFANQHFGLASGHFYIPPPQFEFPRPWRTLEIRVDREQVEVFWTGDASEPQKTFLINKARIDRALKLLRLSDVSLGGHTFSRSHESAIGLYVDNSVVSFRNVVLEPIPFLP